jgi:type VI secretion system secreted protein Hcp
MRRTIALTLSVLGWSFASSTVLAAGYIKFDGVDGGAKHKDHKQWIDVQSFSTGGVSYDGRSNRLTADNLRSGSGGQGTLTFTKTYDRSSPRLAEHARAKRRIRRVEVDLCETEQSCVSYRINDAVIERYSIAGDQEEIVVSYPVIEWTVPVSAPPRRAR